MPQDFAVELAMLLDDQGVVKDREEAFKLTLIGNDPVLWMSKFYPKELGIERFGVKEEEFEYDLKDTRGEWVMPEISEDEFYALERELADKHGTLTIEDLGDLGVDDEGEWQ